MLIKRISIVIILSIISFQQPIIGMDVPRHATKDAMITRLKSNEHNAKAAAAAKGLNKPMAFKLLVIHPTPRLERIDAFVHAHRGEITNKGYKISKKEKRHLTLMTFHVPFQNWKVDCDYVKKATHRLAGIVKNHLNELYDIDFTYTNFGTLVRDKHVVAFHQFKTQRDEDKFFRAYDTIVQDFLAQYPNSWMSVPYVFKPHVTVGTRKGETRKIQTKVNLPNEGRGAFENTITLGYRKDAKSPRSQIRISSKADTCLQNSLLVP